MLKGFFKFIVIVLFTMFFVGFGCGVISGVQDADAEPLIGHDTLAVLHKDFSDHNQLPKGSALGVLHWTFGEDVAPLRQLLDRVKPRIVRVHLINATCIRNQNCGKYEIGFGYTVTTFDSAVRNKKKTILDFVSKATKVYRDLSEQFPDTKFLISPALEHNLSQQAYRILSDVVLSAWPKTTLVNSPLTFPAERYRGAWLEGHGPYAPTYVDINSLDGVDATNIAIGSWLKRFNKIKVLYVWSRGYNCRNSGPWQDPRARTSCPTGATSELLAHITEPRGTPPSFSGQCKVYAFKSPNIFKPLAENKGTGDPRADLPVVILDASTTNLQVADSHGRLLGYLGYYGPYQGNQRRYYSGQIGSGKSGYQFSPGWAWLKQGNKCWGPLIPGRRQGDFRE